MWFSSCTVQCWSTTDFNKCLDNNCEPGRNREVLKKTDFCKTRKVGNYVYAYALSQQNNNGISEIRILYVVSVRDFDLSLMLYTIQEKIFLFILKCVSIITMPQFPFSIFIFSCLPFNASVDFVRTIILCLS